MIVLGIESSCDECAMSLVKDGKEILSNVIFTQIKEHSPYYGVVPEIASRLHVEHIAQVYKQVLKDANLEAENIDAIAVTQGPGLVGALLVGLSFAKALALALEKPLIGVNHIQAHLYAPFLEFDSIEYPYLGLLVSGGHSQIVQVNAYNDFKILGTTIDDACGEAFDKVAKHYDLGFPGGKYIDALAKNGNPKSYIFPKPVLKHAGVYDVSYSGLKTAVIHHKDKYLQEGFEANIENLCASFQKTALDIILKQLKKALQDTGLTRVVAGGGVAANSYLREELKSLGVKTFYPSFILCTDNAAMIAGLGYHYLKAGIQSPLSMNVYSRAE